MSAPHGVVNQLSSSFLFVAHLELNVFGTFFESWLSNRSQKPEYSGSDINVFECALSSSTSSSQSLSSSQSKHSRWGSRVDFVLIFLRIQSKGRESTLVPFTFDHTWWYISSASVILYPSQSITHSGELAKTLTPGVAGTSQLLQSPMLLPRNNDGHSLHPSVCPSVRRSRRKCEELKATAADVLDEVVAVLREAIDFGGARLWDRSRVVRGRSEERARCEGITEQKGLILVPQ